MVSAPELHSASLLLLTSFNKKPKYTTRVPRTPGKARLERVTFKSRLDTMTTVSFGTNLKMSEKQNKMFISLYRGLEDHAERSNLVGNLEIKGRKNRANSFSLRSGRSVVESGQQVLTLHSHEVSSRSIL